MKGILAVPKPASIEVHICGAGDCPHVFPHLERSQWKDHRSDHCPLCGSLRFQQKQLRPVRR
jgi:hypothetical protein